MSFTLAEDFLAAGELLFQSLDRCLALDSGRLPARERLLQRRRLLAIGAGLALGLHQDVVRLLLGRQEGFLLGRLRVALGVLREALRLLLGAANRVGGDAFSVGDPDREHRAGGDRGDQGWHDGLREIRQHA